MNRKRKTFQYLGYLLLIMVVLFFVSPNNISAEITTLGSAHLGLNADTMTKMIAEPNLQTHEKITSNHKRLASQNKELTSGLPSSQMGVKLWEAYDPPSTDKSYERNSKIHAEFEAARLIDDNGNFDWKEFNKLPTIDGSTFTKTAFAYNENVLQDDDSTVIDDPTKEPYKYSAHYYSITMALCTELQHSL